MLHITTTEIIIGILVIIIIFLIYQNGTWSRKSTPEPESPESQDANSILNKLEQSGAVAATPSTPDADPEPAE